MMFILKKLNDKNTVYCDEFNYWWPIGRIMFNNS